MSETRATKPDQRRAPVDPEIARLAASRSSRARENPGAHEAVRRAFQASLNRGRIVESKPSGDSTAVENARSIPTNHDEKNPFHRFHLGESNRQEHASEPSPGEVSARTESPRSHEPRERPVPASEFKSSAISRETSRDSTPVHPPTIERTVSHAEAAASKQVDMKPIGEERRLAVPAIGASFGYSHAKIDKKLDVRDVEQTIEKERPNSGRERALETSRATGSIREIVRDRRIESRAASDQVEKMNHKDSKINHSKSSPRVEVRVGRAALEPRGSFTMSEAAKVVHDHPVAPMEHSFGSSLPSASLSNGLSTGLNSPSAGVDESHAALAQGELAGIKDTLRRLEEDFRRANTLELPSGKRAVYSER